MIPPLVGFYGKLLVLQCSISNGYYFLALVAILTSVISANYYLRIINILFFDKVPLSSVKYTDVKKISNFSSVIISLLTMLTLTYIF